MNLREHPVEADACILKGVPAHALKQAIEAGVSRMADFIRTNTKKAA